MSLTLCPSLNQCDYLIDTKERIVLKEGVIEPLDFDEARPYRLLYGTFKSQPFLKRTRLEVMQYIGSVTCLFRGW
ncbi:hypothetical protein JCM19233_5659 [Vibrio astriarenae]|nr:hypothetical protein JCM19233_5659 [Vibrio sp. C7]